jgi:uncharacterized protein (TIGR01244 family)
MRRPLDERFSVSGQIRVEDIRALAEDGVTVLINNRPDGEEPDQPTSDEIGRAAEFAGMSYYAAPYQGRPTADAIATIQQVLRGPDEQIHAFCRSGMRSCAAWAVAQVQAGEPVEEIIGVGREAGYDLAPLFF